MKYKYSDDNFSILYRSISGVFGLLTLFLVLIGLLGVIEVIDEAEQTKMERAYYLAGLHSPVTYILFGSLFFTMGIIALICVRVRRVKTQVDASAVQNEEQSTYLGDVAKQLWRPINEIGDQCANLLGEYENEEIMQKAMAIVEANEEVSSVVNDMVDFSMIASHQMKINEKPYKLVDVIRETKGLIEMEMIKKGLDFEVYCDPHIPSELIGDAPRIEQVLMGILSNAIKYTKDGKVVMRFGMESLYSGDIILMISVKDTGWGMSKETKEALFDAYIRKDGGETTGMTGTGLGMAIVKRLVDMMKGAITVESTVGIGTEFIVRVPQRVNNVAEIGDAGFDIRCAGSSAHL